MIAASFACPKCHTALQATAEPGELECACPSCGSALQTWFFPALYRPPAIGSAAAELTDSSEASCFYHPQKQAAQVCDGCGRLICNLCSIDLGSEHLCPACLSAGRRKGKITTLETRRTRYDRIAFSLAIFGLLGGLAAPVALYFAIRHWNSPGSIMGVNRILFVLAILIASLDVVGWLVFYVSSSHSN
jgi:hypothetical protein